MAVFFLVKVPSWLRKKEKVEGVTYEQFEGNQGFALDVEGQKVAAVKLPSTVAKEITGQASATQTGLRGYALSEMQRHRRPLDYHWNPRLL